ncbi:MAG: type II toxin-antitoxin system HipA family toxin, partial [Bacteroidales bacterium]
AEECEVSQRWIGAVETTLNNHLAEWGLLEQRKNVSFRIGDTIFENVRVEKAYKGNYHLLCEVEGKERKFVITSKKEKYTFIDKVGIDNLTDEQLCSLVKAFFVR